MTKPDDKLIAGERIIKLGHVSTPQVEVFLPSEDRANGSAVVVCPGGGFSILAWDLEGTEVAEWLNGLGIAAIVLKYRVPTRQHGEEGDIAPKKALGPMMDIQRALSLTRAHVGEWNLEPDRIGVLGFSAGGQTAALAAVAGEDRSYGKLDAMDDVSCRPDFAMLIYPGGLADPETGELRPFYPIEKDTPPMFFAHAADDRVTALASTALFNALNQAGVPAEVHVFAKGGHGYGLRPTKFPVTRWPTLAEWWLEEMNLLGPKEEATGSGHSPNPAQSDFEDVLLSFAARVAKAKQNGEGLPQFSVAHAKATVHHAEMVQKHYVAWLLNTKTFGGIKGAVVGKGGQDFFQIDGPLSAVLFADGWHDAKDKPTIPIRVGAQPGIETELGIILLEPITEELKSVAALKKKVRALVPVIELPAGKRDWSEKPKAVDLITANVDSDHYIVGPETTDLSVDLDALPIELYAGDDLINATTGGDAHRGQWWNFLHQVNWAVRQGYELKSGHLVITGALGKIRKDGAGSYRAMFGELGEIEFSLGRPK